MSLDKAIASGKEHRKPWIGRNRSKNIDCTYRNHGSCEYCKSNRLYQRSKTDMKSKEALKDMVDGWTGEWTYDPNTPENKKCDLDRAADVILKSYRPQKITLEELALRLVAAAEEDMIRDDKDSLYSDNGMLNRDVFAEWLSIETISEYDYEA